MNGLIKDRPMLGREVHYKDEKRKIDITGTITGVRPTFGILFNVETMREDPAAKFIQVRIKPNGEKRAFWSRAMKAAAETT